ncbi:MAG TPA: hypothetical protein VFV33_18640 [Gemmatimonadaceae bacterium]|nr:hypothetical protein [Gemmatimonadaceae bacterium]
MNDELNARLAYALRRHGAMRAAYVVEHDWRDPRTCDVAVTSISDVNPYSECMLLLKAFYSWQERDEETTARLLALLALPDLRNTSKVSS